MRDVPSPRVPTSNPFITNWVTHSIPYPIILGTSFIGSVKVISPSVTTFQNGDSIAVIRPPSEIDSSHFGAFQKYALATVYSSSKSPSSVPTRAAAATILNLAAVVSALSIHLRLSRPSLDGELQRQGKRVLIYRGSSLSGGLAVKHAVTAGYTVITTSSP